MVSHDPNDGRLRHDPQFAAEIQTILAGFAGRVATAVDTGDQRGRTIEKRPRTVNRTYVLDLVMNP
jgi:hypothetical protein